MTKPREKTREELTAEIEESKKKIRQFENREKIIEDAKAFLRLALTSEPAQEFLKKRAGDGNAE